MRIVVRPAGARGAMWRALAVFRVASLIFVIVQAGRSYDDYQHPAGAVGLLIAMAIWTTFAVVVQPMLPDFERSGGWNPRAPALAMVTADLAMSVATLMSTRLIDTHERVVTGAPTLPGTWTAGAVLGAGIVGGARLGVGAAVVLSAALFAERDAFASTTSSSATLLVLAGLVVGYLATTALRAEQEMARVRAFEATRAERDRLARAIHDGALQALALIAREADVMTRPAIAALASEHEAALRSHVTALVIDNETPPGETIDLRQLIALFETAWPHRVVSVAMPGEPVILPIDTAKELAAAVRATLENVDRHAGETARAWVLVEDEPDCVTVSVRDDGVGMAANRPHEARAAGRIGLAGSIVGRVQSLGGTATVTSEPGAGVEVELRVPRR